MRTRKEVINDWKNYLTGSRVSEEIIKKAVKFVIEKSEDDFMLDEYINQHFSPRHREKCRQIIEELGEIYSQEIDEEITAEQALEERLEEQRYWHEYPDLEQPDAEIVIFAEKIEVRAFTTGVGDRLPRVKGRAYHGELIWTFPVSALEELKKTRFPILKAE